jgi:putative effector of murein hydrolase
MNPRHWHNSLSAEVYVVVELVGNLFGHELCRQFSVKNRQRSGLRIFPCRYGCGVLVRTGRKSDTLFFGQVMILSM